MSQRRTILVLMLFFFLAPIFSAPVFSQQQGIWNFFEINAQFRGSVKKGFSSLGCALAFFSDLGGGKHQVILHACVKHPEKKKEYYAFRVNLSYLVDKNGVKTIQEVYTTFDNFETQHQDQIKDILILLAMIRTGLIPHETKDMTLNVNQSNLFVKSKLVSGGKRQEVTTTRDGKVKLTGKFFLDRNSQNGYDINKFHLRREKISVSFVSAPLQQIQQKFQNKDPYNKIVFSK